MTRARALLPLGVAAVMLAGCDVATTGVAPSVQARRVAPAQPFERGFLAATKAGLYVGEFYGNTVYGFRRSGKGAAVCTISGVSSVNDIASDAKGDLIEPDGGGRWARS